ncbi:MAG: DUF4249 domain-containing protein [Bacteroidales bacterium]
MKKENTLPERYINYSIAAASFLMLLLASCTERINIDLDSSDAKIVVYGAITTDTLAHRIVVTQSADYYSNKPAQTISGAALTITDGENTFPLSESEREPGAYYTQPNVFAIPGRTYTLNASGVAINGSGDFKTLTAKSTIPALPDDYQSRFLDSINIAYDDEWEGWVVNAWANEPADQENYYMTKVYINNVLYSDSLNNLMIADDELFNGNSTNGAALYFIEDEDTIRPGYKVTLELCVINEDYYKFIYEAQTSSQPQIPLFSPPSANARTNLDNGAIGFFSAYAILRASYVVRPEDIPARFKK